MNVLWIAAGFLDQSPDDPSPLVAMAQSTGAVMIAGDAAFAVEHHQIDELGFLADGDERFILRGLHCFGHGRIIPHVYDGLGLLQAQRSGVLLAQASTKTIVPTRKAIAMRWDMERLIILKPPLDLLRRGVKPKCEQIPIFVIDRDQYPAALG